MSFDNVATTLKNDVVATLRQRSPNVVTFVTLLCQKPMLRQIVWRLQNGPITKSGVSPVTTLFLWKMSFSFRTS